MVHIVDLGISFLFITHDLTAAAAFADQILVLRAGQVVEKGNASAVIFNPQHSYTQALLGAANHSSLSPTHQREGEEP